MTAHIHRRSPWPYAIVASFAALAVFDAIIITLALKSGVASVETRPYDASLKYDEVIAAKNAVKQAGIEYSVTSNGDRILVKLAGLPSDSRLEATLNMMRPSDSKLDSIEHFELRESRENLLSEPLKPGLWVMTIKIAGENARYQIGPQKVVVNKGAL
ncbi:MAG: FixH family protein [Deltaproteobacteria bacterium]|nr:FixH family protein [Deltaproteobacteria bacterium]